MTQVDGVRRGRAAASAGTVVPAVRVAPRSAILATELERPQPLKRSAVAARLPQGRLDGIRPTGPAITARPRPALASRPAPAPTPMLDIARRQPEAMPVPVTPSWWSKLTSWRPDTIAWRRPMIGFSMVAVAFVAAGLAVRTIAPPAASTARAQQVATESKLTLASPAAVTATPQSQALQQLLDVFAAKNPGMFSLYVKDLKTGETATVAPERVMTSASLYKLFVAQRTLAQVDLGQRQLGESAGGGTGQTVDGCLNLMITISDNGCGVALGNKLGWGAQDQALSVEGYHDTDLASPQKTSARDVATLFEKLYRGTLLSSRSSDELMSLLKNQRVNNRLPQGIPAGTVIAHKTGDLDGYVHDAGIVYGPKTDYLVVVMSGPWNSPGNAPAAFEDLSGQLWAHFER